MNCLFVGMFYGEPVTGSLTDGVLTAPGLVARRIRSMVQTGQRVSWANMTGLATLDGWLAIGTIDYALDKGTARFQGLPSLGPELPDSESEGLAEAWGSAAARAKQAADELRVGGGHAEGGQFSKKVVPAIGKGGPNAGRPAVGTPGSVEPHTLFRPDGKTIFGHSLPPNVREATPEERKAARIPPGYPLGYVTPDGKPLESGIVGWGVDSQGRIKRFYTPESEALRQKQKFERIRVLSGKLGDLDRDLREKAPGDDRAAVAMLVRATGMRPGSERKTGGQKQAFGATTLQAQHVSIDGDLISFDFIGKNGKPIQFETHNRVLAAALEPHLAGKSGEQPLFPGVNENDVNAYLKGAIGDEFKTKDLRTVLATTTARARVDELHPEDIQALSPAERKRVRKDICEAISERLGNTPAEVQKSYVDPGVWDALGL